MSFYDLENVQMIEYQYSDASQTHEYDEKIRIVHIAGNEFDDFINELKDYHRNPKKVYNN